MLLPHQEEITKGYVNRKDAETEKILIRFSLRLCSEISRLNPLSIHFTTKFIVRIGT